MSMDHKTEKGPSLRANESHTIIGEVIDSAAVTEYILSPEMDRRVLRKTDMFILPMMMFVFFCQYLDKQSLSYAAVYGLIKDLKMEGNQYSWCSSIFYVGQLVSNWPYMYLMSRLPLNKLVGVTIIVWGGICMCLAAPTSFRGFLAVRFFLGVAEGAVSPAFVTITSIWYKKSEHPMRIGCWYSCNAVAQVVGAMIMYGLGEGSTMAIAAWRVCFLVCGSLTIVSGIVFFFLMPSGPDKAWFLSKEERLAAAARLLASHDGGDKTNFSIPQFKEALMDWKTLASFLFGILETAPSPIIIFASLVIKNLGYTSSQTLLYGAPSGAVQLFFIWVGIFMCKLFPKYRCLVIIGLCSIPLTGNILMLVLPFSSGWGMIVGAWLGSVISDISVLLRSLNASNVKGNTKRSIINACLYIGYCTGGIAFPQIWTANAAPRYLSGLIVDITSWGCMVAMMLTYWFLAQSENKRRDRLQADGVEGIEYAPGADVTDKEDLSFRYNY